MKIYFARHGESEANLLHEFSNRGIKHGLTDNGRAQAAELAAKLASEPIRRIYSSPLLRATQTAGTLAEALGLEVEVTDALREYDCGVLEGRSDEDGWKTYYRVLEAWIERREWDERIEAGESFNDIRARFVPFIEGLTREYKNDPGKIVLVGHGGTYRCMLPLVLPNIGFDFAMQNTISNTGCVVAELTPRGLRCVEWCGEPVA